MSRSVTGAVQINSLKECVCESVFVCVCVCSENKILLLSFTAASAVKDRIVTVKIGQVFDKQKRTKALYPKRHS